MVFRSYSCDIPEWPKGAPPGFPLESTNHTVVPIIKPGGYWAENRKSAGLRPVLLLKSRLK